MAVARGFLFIDVAQVGWRVKEEDPVCSVGGGERDCNQMTAPLCETGRSSLSSSGENSN
jgi:hypothetical protein